MVERRKGPSSVFAEHYHITVAQEVGIAPAVFLDLQPILLHVE